MNEFNELYESMMNEGTSAKTVAMELAKAFDGNYEEDKMSDQKDVWNVYGSNVTFSVGSMGDYITLEDGRLSGQDKTLVKGIGRRMGYEVEV